MADVITIDTDKRDEYEESIKYYLKQGYNLKSCSCGYYGSASDSCFPYWMAILVRE